MKIDAAFAKNVVHGEHVGRVPGIWRIQGKVDLSGILQDCVHELLVKHFSFCSAHKYSHHDIRL
jgi:hypothetical protein